eukprot:gnl/TRDRNA2_/TRDRNA2_135591_c0_seq1.p1 gnl/TRDRNA2_/TRDRNA2_135591_c0~~gnl/TRDRNA2_/TRDRNA2_135591_c0_seq1.p1  ORF type:complete len:334 (+),score=72.30 gnl/TRDRNA2_/TRDRNA2_135591_c0_seq1:788-1789(+)
MTVWMVRRRRRQTSSFLAQMPDENDMEEPPKDAVALSRISDDDGLWPMLLPIEQVTPLGATFMIREVRDAFEIWHPRYGISLAAANPDWYFKDKIAVHGVAECYPKEDKADTSCEGRQLVHFDPVLEPELIWDRPQESIKQIESPLTQVGLAVGLLYWAFMCLGCCVCCFCASAYCFALSSAPPPAPPPPAPPPPRAAGRSQPVRETEDAQQMRERAPASTYRRGQATAEPASAAPKPPRVKAAGTEAKAVEEPAARDQKAAEEQAAVTCSAPDELAEEAKVAAAPAAAAEGEAAGEKEAAESKAAEEQAAEGKGLTEAERAMWARRRKRFTK